MRTRKYVWEHTLVPRLSRNASVQSLSQISLGTRLFADILGDETSSLLNVLSHYVVCCITAPTAKKIGEVQMALDPGPRTLLPSYIPIDCCVAGEGVSLDTGVPSIYPGCRCPDHCTESTCSCTIAYTHTGALKEQYLLVTSPPVFECNSQCSCSAGCPNRVSQRGLRTDLRVAETEHKGFGVFTDKGIPIGGYIGEYIGEVISNIRARERLKSLGESEPCFILTFREHMPNGTVLTTNIDATYQSNIIRFVNHSCSPNAILLPVRTDSIIPRLCLFACREISPGEEVCFSYFGRRGLEVATAPGELKLGKKPCFCGSKECVGFLPLEK